MGITSTSIRQFRCNKNGSRRRTLSLGYGRMHRLGLGVLFLFFFRGATFFTHPLPFFSQSDGSSTFLSNFGALMQGNVQDHSGGQPLRQHQHQRVPQQHEEQPLSYPFTIGSDMRSNDATEFECVICVLFCCLILILYPIAFLLPQIGQRCHAYERQ